MLFSLAYIYICIFLFIYLFTVKKSNYFENLKTKKAALCFRNHFKKKTLSFIKNNKENFKRRKIH